MMRKLIIAPVKYKDLAPTQCWFDLADLATVYVTSEDPGFPVEGAFVLDGLGWRAASSGIQTVRLIFEQPQRITRIWLLFEETENSRTQEFVLRWSADGHKFHEILRQQWNFSSESGREIEDYKLDLSDVTMLELIIVPDIGGSEAKAWLGRFSVA